MTAIFAALTGGKVLTWLAVAVASIGTIAAGFFVVKRSGEDAQLSKDATAGAKQDAQAQQAGGTVDRMSGSTVDQQLRSKYGRPE